MNYANYDQEDDPTGAIGHALADRRLRAIGYDFGKLPAPVKPRQATLPARTNERYHTLMERTLAQELRVDQISADTDAKTALIQTLYPVKFGPGGRQDITAYSPAQRGVIFRELVKDASKKLRRQR